MENGYSINWKRLNINQDNIGTPVHPLVALAFAPIIGLAFLMFLPFIGFYLTIEAMVLKTTDLFVKIPVQSPIVGAAHFTGSDNKEGGSLENDLEEVNKEIQSRRAQK